MIQMCEIFIIFWLKNSVTALSDFRPAESPQLQPYLGPRDKPEPINTASQIDRVNNTAERKGLF